MKKLFTILAAMLISMVSFAQTPVYELVPTTGSNNSYAGNCDVTIAGIKWNLTGNSTMQPWRIGGKNITNQDRALYSKTAMPFNISKIEVTHGTASSITVNSFKVIVSDAANGAGVEIPVTFKASATTTIELPAGADYTNKYFKFLYNVTNTSTKDNRFVQFTGAKFYAAQAADEAKAPTIEGEANFAEKTTVTITAAEGAKIYYTLDGTEPTNASTEYTAPFELTETTTVKAIAFEGEKKSIVMSSVFTKATVATCAEAAEAAMKVASNNALTSTYYVIVGYVTEVIDNALSNGQQRFWVSDTKGGANTLQSYYCNVPRVLAVGDKVQMFGQLTKYNTNPQMKNGQVTILPEDAPAATVVTVENTTISEMGQNLVLQGQWNEKAVTISLYPGVTKGFGVYSGEGEGDFWGTIGTSDLFVNGTDATYTDNGNGTFTFKATMKDATNALYEITMNGLIPVKHTYTVAGSPVAVFGTEYDPKNAENDMFLYSGTIYAWEKSNLTLSAGKIEFKVCEDHAWTTAYPAQNYVLNIPASGIYTIMIMFDAASGMVEAFAEKTGEAVVIPTIAIAGDMNGWNTTANTFTIAEDEKTASLALNLEAKDYGFKMIIAGSWTSDAQKITRENNVATYTGANADNGTLTADVAGEYIFTWTYETNTLVVTYPAKEEPQPVATWDEIVFTEVAAKGSLNGAVFTAANNAAFTLTVTDTDASKVEVDANTASFGTAEENATYTFRLKTGGKSSSKNGLTLAIPADGKLRIAARPGSKDATDRNIVVKQGETELYNQVVLEEKVGDYYSYVLVDVKQGTVTIEYPVNSLYLYAFGFQAVAGPTVGFENIEATEKAVKFIENGQIFILRDGAVFNLMGARVK
ncbi:MAG: chitobiase/beta-hexosaminidase C-terminal domain-containing protein [Paludibacteraceae bacterium]|nr:chitobiase/beta-hexosaminidase C-terminal domain-containing protein [Paludibacteraceae bacterium]